jgi:hypothetical protein
MAEAAQSLSLNHIPIFRRYPGVALVLARRMARKAVEHRMRGEGVRVQYVPIAIIREQAQAYLEAHRELLDKAAEIVRTDPGLRALAEQEDRKRERQRRKWLRKSGLLDIMVTPDRSV